MSQVKLILLEDVETLGLAGEEVNVAVGYARNYLLPRNLAAKATPGALRVLESRRGNIEEQRAHELEKAKSLVDKIAALEISIQMQASEDDQLFGSVTERVIADKMAELGVEVDHNRIKMSEPIKTLGEYTIDIKLHHDVATTAKVWVVRA
jgi:large subunit ribosomal protein L9